MHFKKHKDISTSEELSLLWQLRVQSFVEFPIVKVDSDNLDFNRPLDYFNLDSDAAEKLKIIGQPYDLYNNIIINAIPDFELNILSGINDEDGIGSILSNFTNLEREKSVYRICASFLYYNNCIYCALTIYYQDKDFASELHTAVLEINQDEEPYIYPIFINEKAVDLFSFDEIQAVGEYLANVWFGIQYEMVNCPEEVRVVEQRGPIVPSDSDNESSKIVYVKKVIPVDESGNPIKYDTTNSGRVFKKPAWNVRGHMRTLHDGRQVPVKSYPKGKARDNINVVDPKQYIFDNDKITEDSTNKFGKTDKEKDERSK